MICFHGYLENKMKIRLCIIVGMVVIGIIFQSNSVFGQEMEEPEPESVIVDPCGPTVLTNSDICDRSLSQYPIIIIIAFILVIGLLAYWFTLGKKK